MYLYFVLYISGIIMLCTHNITKLSVTYVEVLIVEGIHRSNLLEKCPPNFGLHLFKIRFSSTLKFVIPSNQN